MTQQTLRVSEREAEVLAALGEHLSNAQIASRLHLSVRTVETHVSSLLRKLGATDRRELAGLATTLGHSTDDHGVGGVRGLPATWTPFVGRARERAELADAVQSASVVTLLGPGGAGKTRLAAAVAEDLAPGLAFGVTFVELVSVRPGFLVEAVAATLGVMERPGTELLMAVVDRLRPGRALLVLDNCEHLVDDTADFLRAVLARTNDLLVLTTSRERIGLEGERVVALGGLSLVAQVSGGAAGSDAVTMFFDRARALDAEFDADPSEVGELCAQLDGLPLAIELASARTAALGIAGLRAGLSDQLRLLSGGRSADERHRSLRAVLDWSHNLLDEDERRALRRLGRFAGDFDIAAAGAVTDLPVGELADLVGRLADKSLLVHRRDRAAGGWALVETVRAYALEKLGEAGEDDEVGARYLQWAVATATELETALEHGIEWRGRFDLVVDDLRAVLMTASNDTAARLARALGHLTYARRFLAEARRHYATAAENADDPAQAARDLWAAAWVAQVESRGELRHTLALAAADRAAAAGDRGLQAAILAEVVSIGTRFPALFEADADLAQLQHLLALAEQMAPAGDVVAEAQVAAARAWTETRVVEVPEPDAFQAALRAAHRADDPVLISAAYDALCSMSLMAGRLRAAFATNTDRAALAHRLAGHRPRDGSELHDILHMTVENSVAAGELPAAVEAADRFSHSNLIASTQHMFASKPIVPLALVGRFDEAIELGREARVHWERSGGRPARWMAPSMYAVTLCLGLRGFDDERDEWREFAIARVAGEQTRNVHFQVAGMVAFADARVALHQGRFADAAASVESVPTGADAWWSVRHWYFDAYPWAMAAEIAVAAALPGADARLAAAAPAGEENLWAGACLARARGRRTGDRADFETALAGWERLGARFERAYTLTLMPDRAVEGAAELAELGVAPAKQGL